MKLMSYLRNQENYNEYIEIICSWILIPTDLNFIQFVCVGIYCFSDPLLAYKCTFLIQIQIFFVNILKVFSTIPRPYWIDHKMNVTICQLDYSGPSDHIWVGAQFYTYLILIFFYKYAEDKNICFVSFLLALVYTFIGITAVSLFYLAQTFMFECLTGIIYSILIVITFIKLDKAIQRWCSKLCFDIYHSRRQKFMLLFLSIGVLMVMMIYYQLVVDDYDMKPEWLRSDCLREKQFNHRLGIDYTYFDFAKIFTLIGATFGTCFAATNIDGYLSQETPIEKRIVRSAIGLMIFYSVFYVTSFIPVDNYLSEFLFVKSLPNLVGSYLVFGIYPYSWKLFRLIDIYYTDSTVSWESSIDQNKYL